MNYKLCAIDLDDTLLGDDHRISARNAAAIASALSTGLVIVLASGRMHAATAPFAAELGLTTPVISYNGAMVKLPATNEVWYNEHVSADLATSIVSYCRDHGLQLNYYLNDLLYTAAYTPWMKLYHERTGAPIEIKPDFYTGLDGTTPTKLIIVDSPETTNRLLPHFRERFAGELYVTKSNDEYLEFLPLSANKGAALALVAARLGHSAEETVAIGDSWNDIPMLKWAGLAIAVANAKAEVRAIADRITGSNVDDGVADALERIIAG